MKCANCNIKEAQVQIIYNRKHRANLCVECAIPSINSGYAYKGLKQSKIIIDISIGKVSKKDALRYYEHYPEVCKEINGMKK